MIRLDPAERAALEESIAGISGEVYVFGSRAIPSRNGGDIDILIFTDGPPGAISRDVAERFFSRCEEKLDVVVMDPQKLSPEQETFLRVITREKFV